MFVLRVAAEAVVLLVQHYTAAAASSSVQRSTEVVRACVYHHGTSGKVFWYYCIVLGVLELVVCWRAANYTALFCTGKCRRRYSVRISRVNYR